MIQSNVQNPIVIIQLILIIFGDCSMITSFAFVVIELQAVMSFIRSVLEQCKQHDYGESLLKKYALHAT
eukprot:3370326-Amphidinium_carterae.1